MHPVDVANKKTDNPEGLILTNETELPACETLTFRLKL